MKQHEINIAGRINAQGKIALYMQELNAFASRWKNVRVIATFKVYEPGTSAALKGYYYNYIVPTVKRALWDAGTRMTDEQTEEYIRKLSPIMYRQTVNENTGVYTTELREVKDLDNSEMIEHIETIKQIAVEELNIYIEDPHIL